MEKTEEWVRMCVKAEEIQIIGRAKVTELDDWYYEKATQLFSIGSFADEDDVWLPRQGQLQEIAFEYLKQRYPNYDEHGKIIDYNYGLSNLLNSFNGFMYDVGREGHSIGLLKSLEQMWLAFLMRTKFEKNWNGKEWVR